jgi:hypothetical protein
MKAAACTLALCALSSLPLTGCLTAAGQGPQAAYGQGAYPGAPVQGYAAVPPAGWGAPAYADPRGLQPGAPTAGAGYGAAGSGAHGYGNPGYGNPGYGAAGAGAPGYGAPAAAQAPGSPWPNPNPAGLPAFGASIDVSAGAETREQAFGQPPAVTLGSARSVQPGSTGVAGAAASARPATPSSVPFGPDGGAAQARPQGSLQALDQQTAACPKPCRAARC